MIHETTNRGFDQVAAMRRHYGHGILRESLTSEHRKNREHDLGLIDVFRESLRADKMRLDQAVRTGCESGVVARLRKRYNRHKLTLELQIKRAISYGLIELPKRRSVKLPSGITRFRVSGASRINVVLGGLGW